MPYLVFIAYGDVPAARHAMNRLRQYLKTNGDHHELQPMLWRFDQLDDPRWRDMALRDAARASTIVLAMSNASTFDAAAEAWLTALTVQQRGATISALAFVGDNDAWTISLQQTKVPRGQAAHEPARTRSEPVEIFAACAA